MRRVERTVPAASYPAQRIEVRPHVTVRRADDGRAPAHDVVAGEQCLMLVEREARVVRRVARRVDRAHGPAGTAYDDLAIDGDEIRAELEIGGLLDRNRLGRARIAPGRIGRGP